MVYEDASGSHLHLKGQPMLIRWGEGLDIPEAPTNPLGPEQPGGGEQEAHSGGTMGPGIPLSPQGPSHTFSFSRNSFSSVPNTVTMIPPFRDLSAGPLILELPMQGKSPHQTVSKGTMARSPLSWETPLSFKYVN